MILSPTQLDLLSEVSDARDAYEAAKPRVIAAARKPLADAVKAAYASGIPKVHIRNALRNPNWAYTERLLEE